MLEIRDEHQYREAIAAIERLTGAEPGSREECERQALVAAVETYAQKGDAEGRKAKPFRSIPTR